jgi:hypothetical protein
MQFHDHLIVRADNINNIIGANQQQSEGSAKSDSYACRPPRLKCQIDKGKLNLDEHMQGPSM